MRLPNKSDLQLKYNMHLPVMTAVARDIEARIERMILSFPSRPMVKSRVKDFESYYKKHLRILQSGQELPITDLIGIRVVCPFINDIPIVIKRMEITFTVTEIERKGSNYSFKEFGYESTHLLIQIPEECIATWGDCGCEQAEVQIRTTLQDAWAEVEHELVYKTEFTPLDEAMKRKLAAVNASLSLADTIFQDIRDYQWQLSGQSGLRQDSFYKQIDEYVGIPLDDPIHSKQYTDEIEQKLSTGNSIDDLLLNALYAQSEKQFEKAIKLYTCILNMNPVNSVTSIIYRHRGITFIACSQYEKAITDFTKALELDPLSYKAAYCRGIAYSVIKKHPQAINDFSSSLDINPYQSFCYYRRGLSFYQIGDFTQALADCESALSLEPSEQARTFKKLLQDKLDL
jgi:putative GTP pyrophosphokinase